MEVVGTCAAARFEAMLRLRVKSGTHALRPGWHTGAHPQRAQAVAEAAPLRSFHRPQPPEFHPHYGSVRKCSTQCADPKLRISS
mmetsp:Transcript_4594/g.10415  ORF Transcript_4594/g.10415 Transcript_4594/m.10415 type:complete len:84 (-) Transcript_4594:525-776(-)